ncbi:MAG TPA: alpha/beta fold hydrolase [Dehalococcoidia bacterium]|nr:alpha/beta fold hydrolase [Dehalococcoidia bacterium]
MSTIHANGIDIRYELLGPRTGTPLVLTHGFAGPLDDWRPEVEPLAQDRPVVLYDVRGHGRTTVPADPAAYSMPSFAADLAALLGGLGIERAHVGGVSMGGMITAQFAVDYPQVCESVVLIDTTCGNAALRPAAASAEGGSASGGGEDAASQWERRLALGIGALAHIARTYGLDETLRREHAWREANDPHWHESPYDPAHDFERIKLMTVDGYIGAAQAILSRPDLTARISEIEAPTLIMVGGWDDFLPCARRDHALIPGSRLVVRRRCGHGTLWRHETFLQEVRTFLADVEAERPVAGERAV